MLILPHRIACDEAWNRNVVIISDPGDTSNNIRLIKVRAKKFLHLEFDDVTKVTEGCKAPVVKDIEDILEFAKQNEVSLVACFAGISRSSAIAYLISCLTASPEDAIKVLDKRYHHPNGRIIKIGAKLLNDPCVFSVCQDFLWTQV